MIIDEHEDAVVAIPGFDEIRDRVFHNLLFKILEVTRLASVFHFHEEAQRRNAEVRTVGAVST